MAPIAVIQLQDGAPAGLLDAWAHERGLALDVRRVDRDDALPEADAVDAAIVLGCEASVNDASIAWLAPLRDWTAALLAHDAPTLGICFGAQLMASVLGAPVTRMATPEIAWIEIEADDPGLTAGPWLAWHADMIGPSDALRVVARNPRGIQAFRAGAAGHQLGVQFHPEVTPAILRDWGRIGGGRRLAAAGTSGPALLRETRRHAQAAARAASALFDGWGRAAGVLTDGR